MSTDNPTREYQVTLCSNCHHPAGRHLGNICNLACPCEMWEEGDRGWWSDQDTIDNGGTCD